MLYDVRPPRRLFHEGPIWVKDWFALARSTGRQ